MSAPRAAANLRPRVLLLTPYFLPAEQGGGSVRAVLYLTQHLRQHFEFVVAARDHDLRSRTAFDETSRAAARQATGLDLRYVPPGWRGLRAVRALLREPFDLIYLNSLMAPDLAFWPLLLRTRQQRVLIAPRGELMGGALAQRSWAKRLYLGLLRGAGLLRDTRLHATSQDEAEAIRTALGPRVQVDVVADLPPQAGGTDVTPRHEAARAPGPLRVLFLSRIDPVKNLAFALDVLAQLPCAVEFSIAGPIGDDAVWVDCQARMQHLPTTVRARYLGAVPHADVAGLFAAHDLLLLPTLGENHGYVVLEALAAGCPVLISDRTPWRDLQALGVGADLPLDDPQAFVAALTAQAGLTDEQRQLQRTRCRQHARQRMASDDAVAATHALLTGATQPKARIRSSNSGHSGG